MVHSFGSCVLASVFVILNSATGSFAQGGSGPLAFRPDTVNWIYGPAQADLGGHAQISIPAGYRFANAEDARTIMRQMNNPIPKALVGVVRPAGNDQWMVVFEYTETGYVETARDERLDSKSILKKLRKQVDAQQKEAGQEGSLAIEWQKPPEYDPAAQRVEWAIVATAPSGKVVNHVVRLLGRHGVLDGIAVVPARVPFGSVPLKEVMSNTTFKAGYAYADYQKGDRISTHDLSDLITSETGKTGTISVAMMIAWAGGAVGLVGICFWAVRRRSARPVSNGVFGPGMNESGLRPLLAAAQRNGNSNGHRGSRRKVFDYQRYYVDLISQVSDRASEPRTYPLVRNGNGARQPRPEIQLDPASVAANLALIDSQKKLIEEQQRLIREQARLIEEKTRLIQEKTQVLEKQAELFGNNIF